MVVQSHIESSDVFSHQQIMIQFLVVSWRLIFADSIWTDSKNSVFLARNIIFCLQASFNMKCCHCCWEMDSTTAVNTLIFLASCKLYNFFMCVRICYCKKFYSQVHYTFWKIFFIVVYSRTSTIYMCAWNNGFTFNSFHLFFDHFAPNESFL